MADSKSKSGLWSVLQEEVFPRETSCIVSDNGLATAFLGQSHVRLRLEEYSDDGLRAWAQRLAATGWKEIHAFFMHEPTAPDYAQRLMQHFDRVPGRSPRSLSAVTDGVTSE